MTNVLVCIGLFCLTMGMFFIGYAVGRLEEKHHDNFNKDTDIPGDSDLYDTLVEVVERREREERNSVVSDN